MRVRYKQQSLEDVTLVWMGIFSPSNHTPLKLIPKISTQTSQSGLDDDPSIASRIPQLIFLVGLL